MNIRTPKRYRGVQRRSIIPWRRLFVWALLGLALYGVAQVLNNRETVQQEVNRVVVEIGDTLSDQMATLSAPPPTPTQDPAQNLIAGDNAWVAGNTTEAVRSYLQSLDSIPNNVGIHNRVVVGMLASGSTSEALEYAEAAVLADPYSSDAWAVKAWAQAVNGDVRAAIASALHARQLDPNNPRAQLYLARALFEDGQYSRAAQIATDLINADPDNFEAYWIRGIVRELGLFEFEAAAQDYQTAYDMAMADMPAMAGAIAVDMSRIQLRGDTPNYQAALETLERAREMNAENTLVLYELGRIYFSGLGDPAQAQTYLQQCVDYNPSSYNCYYLLGRAQLQLQQVAAATLSLEEATRLGTPFARHWWWAANVHFLQADCATAGEYLRKGYELVNSNTPQDLVDAYDYLANTCGINIGRPLQATPEATPEAAPEPGGSA